MTQSSTHVVTDVLYRLLEKERDTLLQLSYLLDHVHKPIFDASQATPSSTFPAPSSVVAVTALTRAAALLHTSPPQPTSSHAELPLSPHTAALRSPLLSSSDYWALFANLPTLYESHARVVRELVHAVHRLRGHHHHHRRRPSPPTVDAAVVEDVCSSDGTEPWSALSSPRSSPRDAAPAPATATPLTRLFCGHAMRRYVAEHMMYTVHYTKSIAPRVLQLARLWRWSGGGSEDGLARLRPTDRQLLLRHSALLDFLHRSFGPDGRPSDGRVRSSTLPEHGAVNTRPVARSPTRVVNTRLAPFLATSQRRSQAGQTRALPTMAPDWDGFDTFLLLLATPLPSLQRWVNAAGGVVGSVSGPEAMTLRSDFVDLADRHLGEVHGSVAEVLARDDVAAIVDLIDDTAALTGGTERAVDVAAPVPPVLRRLRDLDSGRVLVHYGRLQKCVRHGRHERLVFLFSDCLCHVEELASGRLRFCGGATLRELRLRSHVDTTATTTTTPSLCFELALPGTDRVLVFCADTPEQKRQWVDAIRYAMRHNARDGAVVEDWATAPTVSTTSRLRRQQRYDAQLQQRRDPTVHVDDSSHVTPPAPAHDVADNLVDAATPHTERAPSHGSVAQVLSRNSSFARAAVRSFALSHPTDPTLPRRMSSASLHASVHRRVASMTLPLPPARSTTSSAQQSPMIGDALTHVVHGEDADDVHGSAHPLLPHEVAVVVVTPRPRTSSTSSGHAAHGTPLRRPVSERFERAQACRDTIQHYGEDAVAGADVFSDSESDREAMAQGSGKSAASSTDEESAPEEVAITGFHFPSTTYTVTRHVDPHGEDVVAPDSTCTQPSLGAPSEPTHDTPPSTQLPPPTSDMEESSSGVTRASVTRAASSSAT